MEGDGERLGIEKSTFMSKFLVKVWRENIWRLARAFTVSCIIKEAVYSDCVLSMKVRRSEVSHYFITTFYRHL